LVVAENAAFRDALCQALTLAGCAAASFPDLKEAEPAIGLALEPDMDRHLLLGLAQPRADGRGILGGLHVLRQASEQGCAERVLLFSDLPHPDANDRIVEMGGAGLLTRPDGEGPFSPKEMEQFTLASLSCLNLEPAAAQAAPTSEPAATPEGDGPSSAVMDALSEVVGEEAAPEEIAPEPPPSLDDDLDSLEPLDVEDKSAPEDNQSAGGDPDASDDLEDDLGVDVADDDLESFVVSTNFDSDSGEDDGLDLDDGPSLEEALPAIEVSQESPPPELSRTSTDEVLPAVNVTLPPSPAEDLDLPPPPEPILEPQADPAPKAAPPADLPPIPPVAAAAEANVDLTAELGEDISGVADALSPSEGNRASEASIRLRAVQAMLADLNNPAFEEEIPLLILRMTAEFFGRGALFVARPQKEILLGIGGFGIGAAGGDPGRRVRALRISMTAPSLFSQSLAERRALTAKATSTDDNEELFAVLGSPRPTEMHVAPILSPRGIEAILCADQPVVGATDQDLALLDIFLQQAGSAFERKGLLKALQAQGHDL
jgi:hypothetical protein